MRIKLARQIAVLPPGLWDRGMRLHDSLFQTSNIQICICGPVNLHRYCAVQRARGNSANYSTSPSGILLSQGIACAPVRRSSGIKGRIMSSSPHRLLIPDISPLHLGEERSSETDVRVRADNKGKEKISRARPFDRKEMLKELDHRPQSLPIIWWWSNEKNIEPARLYEAGFSNLMNTEGS